MAYVKCTFNRPGMICGKRILPMSSMKCGAKPGTCDYQESSGRGKTVNTTETWKEFQENCKFPRKAWCDHPDVLGTKRCLKRECPRLKRK